MGRKNRLSLRLSDEEWEGLIPVLEAADRETPGGMSRMNWLRATVAELVKIHQSTGKQIWEIDCWKEGDEK